MQKRSFIMAFAIVNNVKHEKNQWNANVSTRFNLKTT